MKTLVYAFRIILLHSKTNKNKLCSMTCGSGGGTFFTVEGDVLSKKTENISIGTAYPRIERVSKLIWTEQPEEEFTLMHPKRVTILATTGWPV